LITTYDGSKMVMKPPQSNMAGEVLTNRIWPADLDGHGMTFGFVINTDDVSFYNKVFHSS